jgi:hypothetical protein
MYVPIVKHAQCNHSPTTLICLIYVYNMSSPRIENRTILEEEEDYSYWHKFRTGRDTSTYLNKENDLTCVDEDKQCKLWADRGECKTNSAYMLKGCRKSCNVCE